MSNSTHELIRQLAVVMHTACDGETCNCHPAAREEFEVCARAAVALLVERGLLDADDAQPNEDVGADRA